jgi:uncharacterized membrane protein YoaK (UPF0700 family)
VNAFLGDVRETLFPERESRHGPLPPLLVAMTLLTGLVDAFSYLALGHVFVANMTGNVVFLGFALAGARGFSVAASVVALASFWSGALVGGKVGSRIGGHRARLLAAAASVQAAFLATSVVLAAVAGNAVTAGFRYGLIVVLGIAMGIQNATARKLAVPDMTTTVLTLTITGVTADSVLAGGKGSVSGRRLIAVAAMLLGGLIGAALVVHAHSVFPPRDSFSGNIGCRGNDPRPQEVGPGLGPSLTAATARTPLGGRCGTGGNWTPRARQPGQSHCSKRLTLFHPSDARLVA